MRIKLFLNTTTSILLQIITLICGFVLPRLILAEYGSDVNGLTQSIKQFLGVITFLELGIGQVIQSVLYKPLAENNYSEISAIISSGSKFFRKLGIILAVYVVVLSAIYPFLIDQQFDWAYTSTLIVIISINSFMQYFMGITDNLLLNADQRGYVQYISQIFAVLLNLFVCANMVAHSRSIHEVKLATSLIFLIRPILVRLYVNKYYIIDREIKYEGEPIKQKWNGIAQHIAAVILEGTDTIVLTFFSTLSNVSVYSVYFLIVNGIQHLYQSATAGLHSMVGALWVKKSDTEINEIFVLLEIVLHWATVLLFTCTGILILPFVQVYTNGLTDALYIQPIFAGIMVLAYMIRCLRTPYNIFILAAGHYKQTQKCHVIAAVLNLLISVLAVKLWGLVGVAIGTLVSIVYQTLWMAIYDAKNLVPRKLGSFIKLSLADLLTIVCVYWLTSTMELVEMSYWAWFKLAVCVGFTSVFVSCIVFGLFYFKEIRLFLRGNKYLQKKLDI